MKTLGIVSLAVLLALPAFVAAQENASLPSGSREPATVSLFDLIERVAKKTGKRFVLDPRVRGLVPLSGLDPDKVDYQTLLAILRVNEFATFTQDGIVNVVPDAIARQLPVPTLTADDPKIGSDELVTRLIRLDNACAAWLVPILRPLMPQSAHLAAYPPSATLLIVDRAANVRRIVGLVAQLDRPPKQTCEPIK